MFGNLLEAVIGLFLVHQLVETWGGRFWIEPGPDHGTQYCFTAPVEGMQKRGG